MTSKFLRLSLPLCLALAVAACEQDPNAIRPGTQRLDKLVSPEAQRRAAAAASAPAAPREQARGMCAEVIRVSEQGRLILDRSNPSRLVVEQNLWQRVPQEARQAIVRCAQELRPASAGNGPIEVVMGNGEGR